MLSWRVPRESVWSATQGSKRVSRIRARSRDERVGIVLIGGRLEVAMFVGFWQSGLVTSAQGWGELEVERVAIRALDLLGVEIVKALKIGDNRNPRFPYRMM